MSTSYVPPGGGSARYALPDGDHVVKATVAYDVGGFEVFEVVAPALPAVRPHVSPWTTVIYLLEGGLSVRVDAATQVLEPGAVAVLPSGAACTYAVTAGPARFLAITSGGGAGRFFAAVAQNVRDSAV